MVQHQELANGRWNTLSLSAQLANIGAEVGRSLNWQKKGNSEQSRRALERGLELFDLTIADARWRARLKEILRARELVCDFFAGQNDFQSTPESIGKYFLPFAVAARSGK